MILKAFFIEDEMKNNITTITWILSLIFLFLTAHELVSDSLTGGNSYLKPNANYALIYLITSIGFAIVTKLDISISIQFIRVAGIIYMLLSFMGFMEMNIRMDEEWDAIVNFNLTSYVQFGVGIILSILGSNLRNRHLAKVT